eukprot:13706-Eustigmatos_ZCMA.PRE.1
MVTILEGGHSCTQEVLDSTPHPPNAGGTSPPLALTRKASTRGRRMRLAKCCSRTPIQNASCCR